MTIDSLNDFPSEALEYTSMLNEVTKFPKPSRVYITFKIELLLSLSDLKLGNNVYMENIFDKLKKNNTFLHHDKCQSYKEHSLGFFVEANLRVTLRETLRRIIHDQLMWIDLDAEEPIYDSSRLGFKRTTH